VWRTAERRTAFLSSKLHQTSTLSSVSCYRLRCLLMGYQMEFYVLHLLPCVPQFSLNSLLESGIYCIPHCMCEAPAYAFIINITLYLTTERWSNLGLHRIESCIFTTYINTTKKTEMGRTCGTYGGEERCIQGVSGKT
jgi:hypothetical protein